MFSLTYLRHELLRRKRQAIVTALGLAVGIGLVVTVTAASAGVQKAQGDVLHALYGVGTDITVTTEPPKSNSNKNIFTPGSAAQHHDLLGPPMGLGVLDASSVKSVAGMSGVADVAGGLSLTDTVLDLPSQADLKNQKIPTPTSFTVDGVDVRHTDLGPYASSKISSGRSLAAPDANSRVAVVDATYAAAHRLRVGSTVTIAGKHFRVIGITRQPQGGGAANVYAPLGPVQALASFQDIANLKGRVDTIYVRAGSSAQLSAVQKKIAALLPKATVTSSSNLADAVSGSLAGATHLAGDLGRWLAIVSLIAAFAVTSLLTMAAVTRRVRELGTLKVLGWRSRRIVGQLMCEAVAIGVVGAVLGVGVGFGGAELVRGLAPELSATVAQNPGSTPPQVVRISGNAIHPQVAPGSTHTIAVHLTAPVTPTAILLAVLLAIAGGLVAGSLGGWRAARLRPAEALRRMG